MMNKLAAALLVLTAGCASETDGAFHITGRLADSSHVTHVVARNPADGSAVVVAMTSDSFDVAVAPGKQWVVTFANANQVGAAMQVATLAAGALDALAPTDAGSLDLGKVTFATGRATPSTSYGDIVDALGLDAATATRLGANDNLALRAGNPDIDNDGVIDVHPPLLDVGGQFRLARDGSALSMTDLITGNDGGARVDYLGTQLSVAVPMSMNMAMQTGTVTFDQPFYGSALGPETPMIMPGTPIGQPHVKFGALEGSNLLGVVARAGHDAPSGTYELGFANGELTFTDVQPPSSPVLEAAESYAVPFIRIRPTDATCVGNCDIAAVALDWRHLTAAGWQPSAQQPAHLDIVLQRGTTTTYLATTITDSIQWQDMPVANTGITWRELSYFTSGNICYMAVSYQSELGMKMTNQWSNPACF